MAAGDGSDRRQSSMHLTCLASVHLVMHADARFDYTDSKIVGPNRMFNTIRPHLPLLIQSDDGIVARTTASVGLIRTNLEREWTSVHTGRNLHKVVRPVRTRTDAV